MIVCKTQHIELKMTVNYIHDKLNELINLFLNEKSLITNSAQ